MISAEELEKIEDSLEGHHAIFYALFQLSTIVFDETIPTACVRFVGEGEAVQLCFNPDFWEASSEYDKLFIICHECLHIIFKHGLRTKGLDPQLANIAADIVVNHYLLDKFNFDRNKVTDWQKYCWVETVFQDSSMPTNSTFEYYYNQLVSRADMLPLSSVSLMDSHSGFGLDESDIEEEQADYLVRSIGPLLSDEDKEEIREFIDDEGRDVQKMDGQQAGTGYVNDIWNMPPKRAKQVKTWMRIIKKWKYKNKHVFNDSEQWVRMNRRTALLDKNLILPSNMEFNGDSDNRIDAWLYLDVSGSCISYKNYFWKAADSIPKKYFNLKMFSFSTRVWEVDMKARKIFGGGGTSFTCIDYHITNLVSQGEKYPNIVMIITDGMGDIVNPKHPDRWHWFLTEGNYKGCIPEQSFIYELSDFAKK